MKVAELRAALSPDAFARLLARQTDPRTLAALGAPEAVRAAPRATGREGYARAEADGTVVFESGMELRSVLNGGGEHHMVRARRVAREHATVSAALATVRLPAGPRWVVTIARLSRGELDDDNLRASAKAVRDAVAHALGVDDGPAGPVAWSYAQVRARGYGVRVTIARAP